MITARQLASAYDLSVASIWRGERPEATLIGWLGEYRVQNEMIQPEGKPDAVSLLGGGGAGIKWYTTPTGVIGCTTGTPQVCYKVPLNAELPRATRTVEPTPFAAQEMVQATR